MSSETNPLAPRGAEIAITVMTVALLLLLVVLFVALVRYLRNGRRS